MVNIDDLYSNIPENVVEIQIPSTLNQLLDDMAKRT